MYVNGLVLTRKDMSDEDSDRLEDAILRGGWDLLELPSDGKDYEYTLDAPISEGQLRLLRRKLGLEI